MQLIKLWRLKENHTNVFLKDYYYVFNAKCAICVLYGKVSQGGDLKN